MIVYIPDGTRRIALRVRDSNTSAQLVSHRDIQLLIRPGQDERCGCWEGGSPWVLNGCWPGKVTGADIANPWRGPDIPTLVYDAAELDSEGRVVFYLGDKLDSLPRGRYAGILQRTPIDGFVFDPGVLTVRPEPPERILPPGYETGRECSPDFPLPPPPEPKRHACVLAAFDIDLGPKCSDHFIDQVSTETAMGLCGENDG